MFRCIDDSCRCLWLNPAPIQEDLGRLYSDYSTHRQPTQPAPVRQNFFEVVRKTVRKVHLNYPTAQHWLVIWLLDKIGALHPAWHDAQLANLFYIPHALGGKLLDVGCGNGSSMLAMSQLGWKVTGIDFDQGAVVQARSCGLNASVNDLFDAQFPSESFDGILMNHVIEHLPNPAQYLQECLRILRPGGYITALTPNADALGHRIYKEKWRGLEVPRHLQIFTKSALVKLAQQAGFSQIESFTSTQGILQILHESKDHPGASLQYDARSLSLYPLRLLFAGWRHVLRPNLSEVAVLRCRK